MEFPAVDPCQAERLGDLRVLPGEIALKGRRDPGRVLIHHVDHGSDHGPGSTPNEGIRDALHLYLPARGTPFASSPGALTSIQEHDRSASERVPDELQRGR